MCTIADRRKIKSSHTTLYLFSALSTRRVRARFPHFDGFHPKFSAGTSPFLLTDLHNILEILYKISLLSFSVSLFPYFVGLTCYCWVSTTPIDRRRQMGVKRIDREESAQKKFVKHRGIREIRVDAI